MLYYAESAPTRWMILKEPLASLPDARGDEAYN